MGLDHHLLGVVIHIKLISHQAGHGDQGGVPVGHRNIDPGHQGLHGGLAFVTPRQSSPMGSGRGFLVGLTSGVTRSRQSFSSHQLDVDADPEAGLKDVGRHDMTLNKQRTKDNQSGEKIVSINAISSQQLFLLAKFISSEKN